MWLKSKIRKKKIMMMTPSNGYELPKFNDDIQII